MFRMVLVLLVIVVFEPHCVKSQELDMRNPVTLCSIGEYYEVVGDVSQAIGYYLEALDKGSKCPCRILSKLKHLQLDSIRLSKLSAYYRCNYVLPLYGNFELVEDAVLIVDGELMSDVRSLFYIDQYSRMDPKYSSCIDYSCIDSNVLIPSLMGVLNRANRNHFRDLLPVHGEMTILLLHAVRYNEFFQFCEENDILEKLEQYGIITSYEYGMLSDEHLIFNNQPTYFGISSFNLPYLTEQELLRIDDHRLSKGFLPIKYDCRVVRQKIRLSSDYLRASSDLQLD